MPHNIVLIEARVIGHRARPAVRQNTGRTASGPRFKLTILTIPIYVYIYIYMYIYIVDYVMNIRVKNFPIFYMVVVLTKGLSYHGPKASDMTL